MTIDERSVIGAIFVFVGHGQCSGRFNSTSDNVRNWFIQYGAVVMYSDWSPVLCFLEMDSAVLGLN